MLDRMANRIEYTILGVKKETDSLYGGFVILDNNAWTFCRSKPQDNLCTKLTIFNVLINCSHFHVRIEKM